MNPVIWKRLGRNLVPAMLASPRRAPPMIAVVLATVACAADPTSPAEHDFADPATVVAAPCQPGPQPPGCPAAPWTKQVLGALPGDSDATALDISDSGIVVGSSHRVGVGDRPFYWTASTGMQPLPLPPSVVVGSAE